MGYDSPLAALPSFLPCNSFFFFFFFLFTSLLIISAPAYASKASAAFPALLQFKQGIDLLPSRLSSWKKGTNCCHWEGVTCDKTGFPTALQISSVSNWSFDNTSKLDPSLFELSHLRVLDLGSNRFGGEIPKRLVELTHLTHLDLSNCSFKGAVPMEISQLSRLVYLNLSSNAGLLLENNTFTNLVSGLTSLQHLALDQIDISMSIKSVSVITSSSMPGLRTLSLESCSISGSSEESILQLRSLAYMNLNGNKLFYIPEFFQNFTSLRILKLANCDLRGFPSGIFLLPKLESLDVSDNDYLVLSLPSKAIPSSSNIQYLGLTCAKLHGDLAVLSNLTKLTHLYLPNCANNGSLPSSWASDRLVEVDLSSNNLKGSIPEASLSYASNNKGLTELEPPNSSYSYVGSWVPLILNLSSCNIDSFPTFLQKVDLDTLDLSNNRVRGKVPSWLWRSANLTFVLLNHNKIDGFEAVNGSCLQNSQIAYFSALNNLIVGEIPTFFCNLTKLEELDMSNNGLTSTIPMCLGSLPLTILDLAKNHLQGQVPPMSATSEIRRNSLHILDISSNMFTDRIRDEIGMLMELILLNISNNNLSGTIPKSLGNVQQMKALDLSYNHLSRGVPAELSNLTFLELLNLSYNDLHGSIPQGTQFSTFDESSFEGNPGLCGFQVHRSCPGGRDNDEAFVNRRGNEDQRKKLEWIGGLGIGFAVGLFMITLPTLFLEGFSNWYCNLIDRVVELLMQGFLNKYFKFKPLLNLTVDATQALIIDKRYT
ncbi:Leucine-rich repeat receptor-like serine/threonine-protein kinase [Nymphaea thermarum]|nr:Leucine-rich repeat receptor-like serine/threonine-protein kinase [Nymphaea thermarum]